MKRANAQQMRLQYDENERQKLCFSVEQDSGLTRAAALELFTAVV
jgi:hypothetical protein